MGWWERLFSRTSDGPTQQAPQDAAPPGRNEPCWCGSGLKYKKCHLEEDERQRAATAASRQAANCTPVG